MNKKRVGWTLMILWSVLLLGMGAESATAHAKGPKAIGPLDPECPCPAVPPFGCCGQLTCDILRLNSDYIPGGGCKLSGSNTCCHNNDPTIQPIAEGLQLVEVRRGRNRPFDGLTDDVRVVMKVNGKRALTGHYKVEMGRGIVRMDNGDRYWFVAGDLYLVHGE